MKDVAASEPDLTLKVLASGFFIGSARYLLGIAMLLYGLTKLLQMQFVITPFSFWLEPLEELHGTTIAWAYLGYCGWFTVLLGWLEFIPGVLLLFGRHTTWEQSCYFPSCPTLYSPISLTTLDPRR